MQKAVGKVMAPDGLALSAQSLAAPNPADLSGLYEKYWVELCLYIKRQFGLGPPEPEDVAQAVFAKYASLDDRRDISNPRAFLYAMARNVVLDYRRHKQCCDSHALEVAHTADHDILYEISPERVLLDRERFHMVLAALERLPPARRRMIIMNRVDGLSQAEIAKRFGMSESSVQKQIERALAECLLVLEKDAGKTKGRSGA